MSDLLGEGTDRKGRKGRGRKGMRGEGREGKEGNGKGWEVSPGSFDPPDVGVLE